MKGPTQKRRYRTGTVSPAQVKALIDHVEFLFWTESGAVLSTSRKRLHWEARRAVVLVLCDHLDVSFPAVGRHLGRDSSSIWGLYREGTLRAATDRKFAAKVWQAAALFVRPERLAA